MDKRCKNNWKTTRKQRYTRLSLLLLSLFVSYQVCITMFGHAHMIGGVMIVHSHPFDNPQHSHTDGQILTLTELTHFVGLEPLVYSHQLAYNICNTTEYTVINEDVELQKINNSHGLRAPPYYSIFII